VVRAERDGGSFLGADYALVEKNALYRCLDKLLAHKTALFDHLRQRWQDLFGASFEVLLYDLTSTYFEAAPPDDENDKRRYGYSRVKRSDCVQVVIALIVTPEGFPIAYEVLPGNTADCKTLRGMLRKIEAQYGKAQRLWVMDRGIPTDEVLAEMRQADPPISYLVGTPNGRLSKLEKVLLGLACPGRRCARAWTSSFCLSNRSFTCWRRAMRASTRNAPCAGASSNGYGHGSSKLLTWTSIARNCS
jgi:hypothetical protein